MVESRVRWSRQLAIAGLVIVTVYHVDEVLKASGQTGFLPIASGFARTTAFGVPALLLSVVSFAGVWNRKSITTAMILLLSGGLLAADGITIETMYLSNLTFPDPLLSLIYGLSLLSLGVIKTTLVAFAIRQPVRQ